MSKDRREEYDEQAYSQDQAYDQDEAYDEEEYDSEDELQEDEDQQEEEDSAYEEEYDEDVFSLEEDLRREHRKQWTQYLVFAICAAVVVGLAIYGSIQLTHRRLESQQGIQVQPMPGAASPQPGVTGGPGGLLTATPAPVNYWPSALFSGVPVLESAAYETTVEDGYAQVEVPSETTRSFSQYIETLVEEGAQIYVRTTRLSVLALNEVEIHLVDNNLESKVVLCAEPQIGWDDQDYDAFPLPEAGKLVSVEEGVAAASRVLTYRLASSTDALAYTSALMEAGWTISGSLEPTNNIFSAVFKKNNLQITVDYFSSGDDYRVRLDYLN